MFYSYTGSEQLKICSIFMLASLSRNFCCKKGHEAIIQKREKMKKRERKENKRKKKWIEKEKRENKDSPCSHKKFKSH
jgi:hypothetical protein